MPSATNIRAGRAFVELFADDTKLVRGLRRAEKRLKAFGSQVRAMGTRMVGAGAAILAPLAGAAKLFSGFGDEVAKMSKRTGVSVESLSELRFVASQTGTEFGTLENAFRKMQRSIYDAGRGLSTQTDALADLGLTFADLDGLSPEDQFKRLAQHISEVEDPTRRAAIAMSLFGRTGTNLLPMFAEGAAGIERLQAEARRLGLTMSAEDAAAAEEFTDVLDKLWKVVKMGVFHVGAALAPVLQQVAETITSVATTVSEWINQNRDLVVTVLQVGAALFAGGVALMAFGTVLSGLGSILGLLVSTITTVAGAIQMFGAVIAFLVSPIGLVIAALGTLGGYLLYTSGAGGKALDWLGDRFGTLKEDAEQALGGISDALAAGDISLAMKVLWLTLKMEWTRGINFLEKAWLNFRNFFIRIGYDAWSGLLALVETIWYGLEVGWIETVGFFSKGWAKFTAFFARTWQHMKTWAKKAWIWIKGLFDDSTAESRAAAYEAVDKETEAAIARIDSEQAADLARAERERQSKRDRARRIHEATMAGIGRENLDRHKALDDEYAQRMAQNELELARARGEWKAAIAAAAAKRKAKSDGTPDGDAPPSPGEFEPPPNVGGMGALLDDSAKKIGAKGSFNAASLLGMQAGAASDKLTKISEETKEYTREIARNTRPLKKGTSGTFKP